MRSLAVLLLAGSAGFGCGDSGDDEGTPNTAGSGGAGAGSSGAGSGGTAGTNAASGSGGDLDAGEGGSANGQAGTTAGSSGSSAGGTSLPARAIATTALGTCALDARGAIHCWGGGADEWETPDGSFVELYSGYFSICAVRADRSAACFDESGRNGTSDHFPTVPVKELGIGYGAICGIDTNDALFCEATTVALDLEPPDDDWLKVSVGTQFACGIRVDDGSIDCFGSENFGTCTYSPPAGQLDPPDGSFTDIATGTNTSCAIRTDGSVACWGGVELDEEAGECELVHDEGQLEAPDGSFLGISVATSHACGIRQDHGVACWGAGTTDDCETGSVSCRQARPPSGRFEQVVTGTVHSCAMTVDRKVTCWGHDGGGRTTPPAEFQ